MGLSIPGLVASVLFYALIMAVGFWGARRRHGGGPRASRSEDLMLGGRSVGLVVGVFTVIGIPQGQCPVSHIENIFVRFCSTVVSFDASPSPRVRAVGTFFSGPMWRAGHVTMLDPLEQAFGSRATALLFLPALLGEVFWCGAILNALGATVSVITGLGHVTCVLVTASVVTVYTCIGGLYSITYTDVLQLLLMLVGLPNRPALPRRDVRPVVAFLSFYGAVVFNQISDTPLVIIFRCFFLPSTFEFFQNLFQRVLSAKTEFRAKALPYAGCVGTLVLSVPVLLLGLVARAARWQDTSYTSASGGPVSPLDDDSQWSLLLPLTLQHLTPASVSFLGQGAVAAAAMSSADACMLSSGALFTKNVYVPLLRPK
ncbi:unnamed protein product, partial [Ixodes persulcatus]